MSEEISTPPPPPTMVTGPTTDERQMALAIYILYLASFAFGITSIVGLVLAYVNRDTAPDWLKSHFTFQIRTFWIGLAYAVIAGLSCFIIIGVVLLPAVAVWFIVRCALGLNRLLKNEPYPTPESWTV